ncbi:MAG: divalent-cation tolerance protein CutA [Gammaproteobacteria bacterium]|nr:divalent-cation tolerance protein CutA [Gammaproteobacteria bacterium]
MSVQTLLVYCTCPDRDSAERITRRILELGLAACVNQLPGVKSCYIWQGEIETAEEVLLLIKTTDDRYLELEQIIVSLHPYELPEVIAVPVKRGLPDYLFWVEQCTNQPS